MAIIKILPKQLDAAVRKYNETKERFEDKFANQLIDFRTLTPEQKSSALQSGFVEEFPTMKGNRRLNTDLTLIEPNDYLTQPDKIAGDISNIRKKTQAIEHCITTNSKIINTLRAAASNPNAL